MMRIAGILTGLSLSLAAAQAETVSLPVQTAVVHEDETTQVESVNVTLTPEGARTLSAFTQDRVGQTLQFHVRGVYLMSATLRSPLDGGALHLSPGFAGFDGITAREIAQRLNEGGTVHVSDEP